MTQILEVWADTGKIIERERTPDEQAQYENDMAQTQAALDQLAAKQEADRVAREAAIEHAKSLGFTDAMIAVMYPNLGAQV